MNLSQIYTKCLAQGSYYIESEGEAVVIDPLREVTPYITKAKENNTKIKYIFETHFHADFVSGHLSLSKETNAPIVFGPMAKTDFDIMEAKDGQQFHFGKLTITTLHTPGHTLESTCYLLSDESGKNRAIFTGDTLFLGDVGRPDLAQKNGLSKEELARKLYDSIRNKILPLEDSIIVYPAHGAGSACGKNMMKETSDTLENQKKINYALHPEMTREKFVKEITEGFLPSPKYFEMNVEMNKKGYEKTEQLVEQNLKFLSLEKFEKKTKEKGRCILDVRNEKDFCDGHIPNSIFIGLDGMFAPWVGTILKNTKTPLLIIAPSGRERETILRLARVGFDNVLGFLEGGFNTWELSKKEIERIESIFPMDLKDKIKEKDILLDVRKPLEHKDSFLQNAKNIPLDVLSDSLEKVENKKKNYIYCGGGYRSVIAISILKRSGKNNFVNIIGGFQKIKQDLGKFIIKK